MVNEHMRDEDLLDQLETQIAMPVNSVSLYTEKEFPSSWHIYASLEMQSMYFNNQHRYKMVLYSLK